MRDDLRARNAGLVRSLRVPLLAIIAALPARAAEAPKLAFFGVKAEGSAENDAARLLEDLVQAELAAVGTYAVIGRKDLETMLGIERQRQLMGCSDEGSSCLNEL